MNSKHYDPQKLILARQLSGKTQQEMADELNVDRITIHRAEQGTTISFENLAKMCASYHIPVTNVILPHPDLSTSEAAAA